MASGQSRISPQASPSAAWTSARASQRFSGLAGNAGERRLDLFAAVARWRRPAGRRPGFRVRQPVRGRWRSPASPLCGAAVAMEAEIRVAVALVGAPGVHVRASAARHPRGRRGRLRRRFASQHAAVEGGGEGLPGAVVHRPAGGDDGAHAHADEFLAEVGGQAEAVELALGHRRGRGGSS
jgi:hypothetical protein